MIMVSRKQSWQDLTEVQRVAIVILSTVQVALLLAALWDISRRPAEKINGSKGWWFLAAFVNFIGPAAYFTVGRR